VRGERPESLDLVKIAKCSIVYALSLKFDTQHRREFMKIKSGLLVALFLGLSTIVSAQSKAKTSTPDAVVKDLYAAHNADRGPFFQTKNRALVDKYFTKDFADLIWNDAVAAGGEVGALGFDPLYNAQDIRIVAFKIGKPMYGEGNLDVADVPVTFKNMGHAETILFRLERSAARVWKISDIYYPSSEAPNSSLKSTYNYALNGPDGGGAPAPDQTSGIRGVDFLNYSFQTSVCSEDVGLPKTVKVRDGKFKDSDKNFFEVAKDETAYGDVNGDGSEDAVVLIRCGGGAGTLRAFEVHAYSLQNGQAKLLAQLNSTAVESDYKKSYPDGIIFYAGETGPKIVDGHVIVEALSDGSFAWPENTATFDYQLSGGKFVLRGKPAQSKRADASLVTDGTFKGTLHAGKAESYMVYVGEQSGDLAAFCFANDSEAGRAILAACKDGETCEFTGKVDQGQECKVDKETQKVLSGSGRVLSVTSVKSLSPKSSGKTVKAPAVSNMATEVAQ
jgi:hypothetical protein